MMKQYKRYIVAARHLSCLPMLCTSEDACINPAIDTSVEQAPMLMPDNLPAPKRRKFTASVPSGAQQASVQQPASKAEAWRLIANICNNLDDVASHSDLTDFSELVGEGLL